MDLPCGLRGLGTAADGPGAAFLFTVRQKADKSQQAVAGLDEVVQARGLNAHLRQEFLFLLGRVIRDILLGFGTNGDALRAFVQGQLFHGLVMRIAQHSLHQIVLAHIGRIDYRLCRQQAHFAHLQHLVLVGLVQREGARIFARAQMLLQRAQPCGAGQRLFVSGLARLGHTRRTVGNDLQVAQDQLCINGLNVPHRVHIAFHMHNVRAFKAAHHMHDGVAFADVAQKFIAQSLAFGRTLHQTGDVHKFHDGGRFFIGIPNFSQLVQPGVRHGHDAGIRVDGAERIVRRSGIFGAGDGVEQRALADIRQAYDT